jgi:DnaA family protein
MGRQTVLPVSTLDDASLENFAGKSNRALVNDLRQLVAGERDRQVVYIWGESGCGKTHLLDACCSAAQKTGISNSYFSLDQGLDQLEKTGEISKDSMVCIDDIGYVAGDEEAQNRVFSLYERLVGHGGALLVSAQRPLRELDLTLKDLESRLASGGAYQVQEMDDSEKKSALQQRAASRGFTLDDTVARFIMSHYSRDTRALFSLLDKLDSESLQSQRKITVPFVKTLIG